MKNRSILLSFSAIVALFVALVSCNKDNATTYKHQVMNLQLPTDMAQYNNPGLPTKLANITQILQNNVTNPGATLGRVLFYDPNLSRTNNISCSSCHHQANGFADPVALSTGFLGQKTKRNAGTIVNPVQNSAFFWDAREQDLESMVLRPIENHVEMGMDNFEILEQKLARIGYYPALFKQAFGDESINKERIASALRQFLQSMAAFNSHFDEGTTTGGYYDTPRFVAPPSFSAQEKAGSDLFFGKAKCGNCHNLTEGTSSNWRDIGLQTVYTDKGVGNLQANSDGMFKVPLLKNIAVTAPYMHDGRFVTLEEVVEHYNSNIQASANLSPILKNEFGLPVRLNLNATEKSNLIAFLHTMTDHSFLGDPKFSNPFK